MVLPFSAIKYCYCFWVLLFSVSSLISASKSECFLSVFLMGVKSFIFEIFLDKFLVFTGGGAKIYALHVLATTLVGIYLNLLVLQQFILVTRK